MLKALFPARTTPPQWINLVEREPWLIDETINPDARLSSDEEINQVFNGLKGCFRYEADDPGKDCWGMGVWQRKIMSDGEVFAGDCDDFAFAVLEDLKDLGAPINSLHMVMCTDPNGRGHMVAALIQDEKTWIFCNQQNRVARASDPIFKNYVWNKMNQGNKWFLIVLIPNQLNQD